MAEDTKHILYLGPPSSFSHAAAQAVFPHATLHASPSFSSIFHDLDSPGNEPPASIQTYDYAIVPIHNSTNGPVVPVVDLLVRSGDGTLLLQLQDLGLPSLSAQATIDTASSTTTSADYGQPESDALPITATTHSDDTTTQTHYRSLHIAPPHTYALAVQHSLYVHQSCPISTTQTTRPSPASQHSLDLSPISSLHTHPQVWTQCTRFLNLHFPTPPSTETTVPPSLGLESHTLPTLSNTNTTTPAAHETRFSSEVVRRFSHASTSDAAAYVASSKPPPNNLNGGDSSSSSSSGWPAVICSTMAGEAYGLKCVASGIEDDRGGNRTTFVILGRKERG